MKKCCDGLHSQIENSDSREEVTLVNGATSRRDFLTLMGGGVAAAGVLSAIPGSPLLSEAFAQAKPKKGAIKSVGWAAIAADKPMRRFEFTRPGLGKNDVLVDIMYCGICHSDIHTVRANLDIPFPFAFPIVPGHEIVGRISRIGSSVKGRKVGEIVGVGPYINSDGSVPGQEQYSNSTFTYGASGPGGPVLQGGFSNNIVVDADHTLRIPKGADLARTAPVLCGGITTYSPLKQWEIKEGSRVGIVGLGGLGHMGLKLAVDRGADVTVFTTSPSKKRDALRMGAKEVVVWPLPQTELYKRIGSLDFILSTVPYAYQMDPFMLLLKHGGVFSNVGLLEKSNPNYLFVNMRQINLTGSLTGNLRDMQTLINRTHKNKKLLPEVQVIPVGKINQAIDSVMNKKARYRYVIDMSTLS